MTAEISEDIHISQASSKADTEDIVFTISRTPTMAYLLAKRTLDVIGSSVLLLVLSPLLIIITVLIKLYSPGPAIFKQVRIGQRGKQFVIYKFRSMHITAPRYHRSPRDKHDPRINAAGKFLRQTSLDELPQLINVLRGEMSLVGPRPEMPFIVATYEPWQRKRLETKPGITGLWQISGRKDRPLHENLEFDMYYVDNQSMGLDLKILLKTVPAVIFRKGAY